MARPSRQRGSLMRVRVIKQSNIMIMQGGRLERAPVGYEMDVASVPASWLGAVEVIQDDAPRVAVTNPTPVSLEDEYKRLTGQDPDGRWRPATLAKRVEEARNAV